MCAYGSIDAAHGQIRRLAQSALMPICGHLQRGTSRSARIRIRSSSHWNGMEDVRIADYGVDLAMIKLSMWSSFDHRACLIKSEQPRPDRRLRLHGVGCRASRTAHQYAGGRQGTRLQSPRSVRTEGPIMAMSGPGRATE
jgi:hypothetical protein